VFQGTHFKVVMMKHSLFIVSSHNIKALYFSSQILSTKPQPNLRGELLSEYQSKGIDLRAK